MIRAVVLDIGETVLDDTREWGAWADWLGVPRHTLSAVVGAVVAAGRDNREAFRILRPGFDLHEQRQLREAAGCSQVIDEHDLYPDVRPALRQLRQAGFWVGLAGNQSVRAGDQLRALDLPVDAIATSEQWGVGKPNPAFFAHVERFAAAERDQILYVGDHHEFDAVAASKAGLKAALIRRGPWGYLWATASAAANPDFLLIDSLVDLPLALRPAVALAEQHTSSTH
jgi:HAD superfamily hydrolase (TIGR01549 family)